MVGLQHWPLLLSRGAHRPALGPSHLFLCFLDSSPAPRSGSLSSNPRVRDNARLALAGPSAGLNCHHTGLHHRTLATIRISSECQHTSAKAFEPHTSAKNFDVALNNTLLVQALRGRLDTFFERTISRLKVGIVRPPVDVATPPPTCDFFAHLPDHSDPSLSSCFVSRLFQVHWFDHRPSSRRRVKTRVFCFLCEPSNS
mmetsp:Transcript_11832/g.36822  ORF Transcript_11832/g.36822 Transcript_11832/m.36822 type:complete len:199 (-) Transcript_11832:21-617(-)